MAISSVSLLKYSSGVTAAGKTEDGDNQLLVERNYVTNSFAGFEDWSSFDVGDVFNESFCVQYGGLIYSCTEEHTKTSSNYPGSSNAKWVRRFPVLHRYTGYSGDGTGGVYAVEHGLGSKDLTVQVYMNAADAGETEDWIPVMMGFELGDANGNDKENFVHFTPVVSGKNYRVVIVAAK